MTQRIPDYQEGRGLRGASTQRCGFLVMLTLTISVVTGCSGMTSQGATSNTLTLSSAVMSDETAKTRLIQEEWLFRQVVQPSGISGKELGSIWLAAKNLLEKEDIDIAEESKQREVLSKLPLEKRKTLIEGLDSTKQSILIEAAKAILPKASEFCKGRQPRLHSVGSRNVLHFQSSRSDQQQANVRGEQVIQIPIEGRDLHPSCVDLKVVIIGQTFRSVTEPTKYIRVEGPTDSGPDSALLVLTSTYLNTLTSGDQLEIHAVVSQHDLEGASLSAKGRVVSYATRTITFYNEQDYKAKVLDTLVPTHDIEAFPLPDEETEKMYGPIVSDNFYVVDLSIRNRHNVAKLVNTGMIVASGRAIVRKNTTKSESDSPDFTIPVSVVPRSATLMYTVLDDEEVEQPRAKFFRGLELVGALASAVTTAIGGMSANQAANLFSGVFIPSAGKALPDRWPGFKRNIVNNAMPDLLKIPANSVAGHKHLFFSKNKIDTLISDQTLFQREYFGEYEGFVFGKGFTNVPPAFELGSLIYLPSAGGWDFRKFRNKPRSGAPSVKVISLQFDNLDVPFEEVVEGADGQQRAALANLELDLNKQIEKLDRVRKNSSLVVLDSVSVPVKRLEALDKELAGLIVATTDTTSQGHKYFVASLKTVQALVKALQPGTEKELPDLDRDLLFGGDHTLESLQRHKSRLSAVSSQILAGASQDTAVQAQLRTISEQVKQSERALEFYRTVAQQLERIDTYLSKNLTKLKTEAAQADSNLSTHVKTINDELNVLVKRRTVLAEDQEGKLMLMNNFSWAELKTLVDKVLGKVSLSVAITGTGTVGSTPVGIACPGTCQKNDFEYGDDVTLKATSGTISSWSGACSGTGVCKIVLDENKTVTATFMP